MAFTGPRGEEEQQARTAVAPHGMTLAGLEEEEAARHGLDRLPSCGHTRVAGDEENEGVLLHLVLTELLSGLEADQDRAGLVLRLQHERGAASSGSLELGQIPAPHGEGS